MEIPQTRYARNGDVHIAYQAFGEGAEVFVGLPGAVSNIEVVWEEPSARRFFTRMAKVFRVVIYDKRGQGLSDRDHGVPTLDQRVEDLGAVLDAEGIERATVGGISEGGSTAALFAASHPERMSKLVLVAAPVVMRRGPDVDFVLDDEIQEAFWQAWAATWGTPGTLSVGLIARSMVGDPAYLKWANRYERQSMSPGGLLDTFRWIRDIDIRSVLPAIRVPTLVVRRAEDPMIDRRQAELTAQLIPDARFVELPGEDHLPWVGDHDSFLDVMEDFVLDGATRSRPADRVLATVLFTDIVGSTERAAELGDRSWRGLLAHHDRITAAEVAAQGGRVIKNTGDGALVTFDGPARALRCAAGLRDALGAIGVPIRAGLHTGEIEVGDVDVAGITVHVAARVEALAGPGEILVTRTVKDLVAGSGAVFEPRGVHALKGVPDDWQIYELTGI